jgi:hypothetical protein
MPQPASPGYQPNSSADVIHRLRVKPHMTRIPHATAKSVAKKQRMLHEMESERAPVPPNNARQIHHSNQPITIAPRPQRRCGKTRLMALMRPMMVGVMVMMPVMMRCRKACGGKQQQRNRDSDELTHDSTYSSNELLPDA